MAYNKSAIPGLAQALMSALPVEASVIVHGDGAYLSVRLGDKSVPVAHPAQPLIDPLTLASAGTTPELFRSVGEVKKALGL